MSDDLPDVENAISYDAETDTYRATFDSKAIDPSVAVVTMLSKVREKPSAELTPLFSAIDPEALDKLLTSPSVGHQTGDREAGFTIDQYEVTVRSCGIVKVGSKNTDGGNNED